MKHFNTNQQIRFDIIKLYVLGEISGIEAAETLNLSQRHIRRLAKRFKEDGIKAFIHGNNGKVPHNKTDDSLKVQITDLYRYKYKGLNIAHFCEKLNEVEKLPKLPSYNTIREILISESVVSPQARRRRKSYARRKRCEREGIMIQIDGSPHRWIPQMVPICLTAAIDDATGKIVGATFTEKETTFAAMDVVEQIMTDHGKFQMLYSDKAGIYGGGKRQGFSNLKVALHELGIISIQANSPQAKGRIERLFKTLQSRLVSEIRLRGIRTIPAANIYLKEFIRDFNSRFVVSPKNPISAFERLPFHYDYDKHMCFRESRRVGSGEVINFKGHQYVLNHGFEYSLQGQSVEVRRYRSGEIRFFYQGEAVDYEFLSEQKVA
jgi:transposase